MKKKQINNLLGFTLLEVLVAIIILSVGLTGTAGLLISVIRVNHLSNEMSKANALAKSTIEQIRQAGYSLAVDPGESYVENTVAGYPGIKRSTEGFSVGIDGAKGIKVTITYTSFGQHTVEMNTIIAR